MSQITKLKNCKFEIVQKQLCNFSNLYITKLQINNHKLSSAQFAQTNQKTKRHFMDPMHVSYRKAQKTNAYLRCLIWVLQLIS
jgi:spore germination protein GerM